MADLLPAEVQVPTILTDPPFRVFDATFHCMDCATRAGRAVGQGES